MDEETVAFRMLLVPGQQDEYRRRHASIWPALTDDLKSAGVRSYRIFLDQPSNHLFAVMRRTKRNGLEDLRRSDLMQRWWRKMADIMETNDDGSPREWQLVEMFDISAEAAVDGQ